MNYDLPLDIVDWMQLALGGGTFSFYRAFNKTNFQKKIKCGAAFRMSHVKALKLVLLVLKKASANLINAISEIHEMFSRLFCILSHPTASNIVKY